MGPEGKLYTEAKLARLPKTGELAKPWSDIEGGLPNAGRFVIIENTFAYVRIKR